MPRNRIWGCDLLVKTDRQGQPHLVLAILDHASRACLRLQRLSNKSSWMLLQELLQAVKRYGQPQFLRTDNEAVLISRHFRIGLWALGIRQQRIQPGCPWQNGRVERFIGTVKRELAREPFADERELRRHCRRSVPDTTTTALTITYKGGHRRKFGPRSMCLPQDQVRSDT